MYDTRHVLDVCISLLLDQLNQIILSIGFLYCSNGCHCKIMVLVSNIMKVNASIIIYIVPL